MPIRCGTIGTRDAEQNATNLPFEHAESLDNSRESVRLFEMLERETGERGYLGYARRHAEIIEHFRRCPHRNPVLGRTLTDEARVLLSGPGSSF